MCFVTKSFKFDNNKFLKYIFQDVVIQADDEIRLKIVGTRVDATGIVSIKLIMGIVLHYINLNIK